MMKQLTILVPRGGENNLSSIAGVYKIFGKANDYWIQNGNQALFEIKLAGVSENETFFEGLFSVKPHRHISEIEKADLVIIPSLNHNYEEALSLNGEMSGWILAQYKKGAEVASICTGAFLLASTGLLDGKSCSTHWTAENRFRTMFPRVRLRADKLITDENGIYTNGGAYSFLNLVIYLVEKYYDRETALFCAKVFQIEVDRNNQSEFSIFSGQKNHDDELVQLAQAHIERNVGEKVTIEELSSRFHVGRRNFDRRFIKATGNTPLEYARRVKMEAAKKAFETNRKTINEVMFDVGYTDVKAFREVFRKITGMSPLQYKAKYHKE